MSGRKNLPEIISDYIAEQRTLGYKCNRKERTLREVEKLCYGDLKPKVKFLDSFLIGKGGLFHPFFKRLGVPGSHLFF